MLSNLYFVLCLSHTSALTFSFNVHRFQMDLSYSFAEAVLNGLSWNPDHLDQQCDPECSPEDVVPDFPEWIERIGPASLTPPPRIRLPVRLHTVNVSVPVANATVTNESNIPCVSVPVANATVTNESNVPCVSVPVVSEVPTLTFFKTQKGGTGVILNGFRFKKHIQYKKSISWRCHQCDVRIKTSLDFCLLGTQNKIHNHPAPSDSDNIQIVSVPSVTRQVTRQLVSQVSVSRLSVEILTCISLRPRRVVLG